MQITNDQWASFVSGWVRKYETEDGYLTFRRFTEAGTKSHELRGRTKQPTTSAGMFIELEGNVKRISFDYRVVIGTTRKFYGISVLEDGVPVKCLTRPLQVDEDTFVYEPTKPCRLTIFLPNLSATFFKNMEIEGEFRPVKRPRKLFIAGDSITQGYDAEEPHRSYANRLTEAMNAETLNQAIGGDQYNEVNLDDLPEFTPDAVVINYGTNDWAHESDVKHNADRYLKKLSAAFPDSKIFVIEPIWRLAEDEPETAVKNGVTLENVREFIRESGARYSMTVIPGIDLVPHEPKYFSDGRLHPNDEGFDFYAERLMAILKEKAPELFEG